MSSIKLIDHMPVELIQIARFLTATPQRVMWLRFSVSLMIVAAVFAIVPRTPLEGPIGGMIALSLALVCCWFGGPYPAALVPLLIVAISRATNDTPLFNMPTMREAMTFLTLTVLTTAVGLAGQYQRRWRHDWRQHQRDRKQAEESLRESEERFRLLANSAPALIWINGPDGAEFVNRTYLDFLGVRNVDIRGYDWAKFIHPDDRDNYVHAYLRAVEQRTRFDAELRFRRHDGDYRWMRTVAQPRISDDGTFLGFAGITIDATERKQAEDALRESEERFRMLADNMAQLAWTCDKLGNVTWYNQRWLDYTGLSFDEMKGWDWSKVQHPDHLERVVARVKRSAESGEPWIDTLPLRGKDGSYRWFLSRALPIRNEAGEITCWFGTNTDVTERRAAEEALKEADRRKDEFLATLAHELRNPLAPLRNMLEIMKRTDANGDLLRQARDTMERQLGHMVRLVDELLDVSRISRNKIELKRERVELASVVSQAVEANRSLAERAKHELTVTLPPDPIYLHGDAVRLAQVFGNLLNNACKYTEPGGKIWLTAEPQQNDVVVKVRDTGVGIAPENLTSVFDMFSQVESSLERSQGGLGIGLALVKRLVEMHEGSVEARSEGPGCGSEFVVRLPVLIENAEGEPQPELISESLVTARRILVVDDNRDSAMSLAMLLKVTGNDTLTAHDGIAAIEQAEAYRPAVILLDIGLPKMNGYDACRRIRAQPWGEDILMVALTGWGQEEDRRKTQEAGFNGHLVKPVEYAALTKLLTDLQSTRA